MAAHVHRHEHESLPKRYSEHHHDHSHDHDHAHKTMDCYPTYEVRKLRARVADYKRLLVEAERDLRREVARQVS